MSTAAQATQEQDPQPRTGGSAFGFRGARCFVHFLMASTGATSGDHALTVKVADMDSCWLWSLPDSNSTMEFTPANRNAEMLHRNLIPVSIRCTSVATFSVWLVVTRNRTSSSLQIEAISSHP